MLDGSQNDEENYGRGKKKKQKKRNQAQPNQGGNYDEWQFG